MNSRADQEFYQVIIIGGGQTGLSAGYYLSRQNISFIILDASERVGDAWRKRWDSLRLFTPARFDSLAGMPFPASPNHFPTKNEMADYLESYARHFDLPVMNGVRVDNVSRKGSLYKISAGKYHFTSEHVVIAMSEFQIPRIPDFAVQLNQRILQIHSLNYKNPSQLKEGGVLVVGAGNSGAEIALEAAKYNHRVWLSGRDTGHIPFHIESTAGKLFLIRLVIRVIFHRILTTDSWLGRKARGKMLSMGMALIRIKPKQFKKAGIIRIPKITAISKGYPVASGEVLKEIKNVVWCTGFHPSRSWVSLPVFQDGSPVHDRGIVRNEPGLYFIGLRFLYSLSSDMVHAAARDSRYIVRAIKNRINNRPVKTITTGMSGNKSEIKEKIYG